MPPSSSFRAYFQTLQGSLDLSNATARTHRPVFRALLETLDITIDAVNEPRRIACGAPDLVESAKGAERATLGYIEAKDLGVNLRAIERDGERRNPATSNGCRLKRYRESLPNLILTDYVEFRCYTDVKPVQTARLEVDE